jgi:hypothetical protein
MHDREMLDTCYLFGNLTGFEFVMSPTVVVVLDTRGTTVGAKKRVSPAGGRTLKIGNKEVPNSVFALRKRLASALFGRFQLNGKCPAFKGRFVVHVLC